MSFRTPSVRRVFYASLSLLLIAALANAQSWERRDIPVAQRFSLSMGGGVGFWEGHHTMLDLRSEIQFSLSPRIRLGLGLGYMNHSAGHEMEKDRDDRRGGWPGLAEFWGQNDNRLESGRDFHIMPLSLNLYYVLPLGRRWSIFMNGGGSYYFGSFRGVSEKQNKNAWGGQAGLGVEFRLANRIHLVAEGSYRFAEFHGLHTQQPQGLGSLLESLQIGSRLRKIWRQDGNDSILPRLLDLLAGDIANIKSLPPKAGSVSLNGFSIRAGLKFSL